jgi:hypothetical protein
MDIVCRQIYKTLLATYFILYTNLFQKLLSSVLFAIRNIALCWMNNI